MTEPVFSYDVVQYPSKVYVQTHPDRLAVMARLLGLDPPDPARARILEIGGGDGLNVLAAAVAWPELKVTTFDLSDTAIARGRALRDHAGLFHVDVRVADILDEAANPGAGYDYILAHGVFAWVPQVVRDAVMRLIGSALAPNGVAYISYNALPGGHLRQVIRDMMLHDMGEVEDPGPRMKSAHDALDRYIAAQTGEGALAKAMKEIAQTTRRRDPSVLFHDELCGAYAPQSLAGISAQARKAGLAYLTDADDPKLGDGFLDPEITGLTGQAAEDRVVRDAQSQDYIDLRAFRESLFVRAEAPVERHFDAARMDTLLVSARGKRVSPTTFECTAGSFDILDAAFADGFAGLLDIWPQRRPVADITDDPDHRFALFRLFEAGIAELHALPLPCRLEPPARPRTSPLARAQLLLGDTHVVTLDQRVLKLDDEAPRAFVALLDGSRDLAELRNVWEAGEYAAKLRFDEALAMTARLGLLS